MARKLPRADASAGQSSASAAPDAGADDLAILNPDAEITIAGRTLTVREPKFREGLKIRARAHDLVRDLTASVQGGEGLTDDVLDVLAKHDALVCELIADTVEGTDVEWIGTLSRADGDLLLLAWWGVNGPFFVSQITRRLADAEMVKALIAASAGPTSSMPSPAPATERPTNSSGTTRAVN